MKKIGRIALICFFVGMAYLLLIVFQPITNAMVETANTGTANWSEHPNYRYAQAVLVGWPFWAYLVPGTIGTFAVVVTLKQE